MNFDRDVASNTRTEFPSNKRRNFSHSDQNKRIASLKYSAY